MPPRDDPYRTSNFLVEIDGLASAGFSEVLGLGFEVHYIEYRQGSGITQTTRKLPVLAAYEDITLRRGLTQSRELFEWLHRVATTGADPRNMSVVLMDEQRREVLRWNLTNAQPKKWSGPALQAAANEVAMEELVLVHEGIELVTGSTSS